MPPTRSPLSDWHRRRGARFGSIQGVEQPLDYGDPNGEYGALSGACLLDLSAGDRLELLGEDRARFLNGLVTCDVATRAPGQGAYGFLTNPKGRILAGASILVLEDRFWLLLPPGRGPVIEEHLRKYVVVDRVDVRRPEEELPLALLGDGLERHTDLGLTLPAAPWSHHQTRLLGYPVRVVREGHRGLPAVAVWVASERAVNLAAALTEAGLVPVGQLAAERRRIEAGFPRFGLDFDEDNLPQETGLDEAIDYGKGCYLGQEVVARLHYRGQVARRLCRLEIEPGPPPATGASLVFEEREAGRLTSVAAGAAEAPRSAIATLKRRAAVTGTRLELENGRTATVTAGLDPSSDDEPADVT